MGVPSYAPLDAALDTLSGYGPQLSNGNFNHAPMVTEALCALGRPEAVMPWIERYRTRLLPRAAAGTPIDPAEWRAALGQRDRFAAWSALFAAELRDAAWQGVLERWVDRLAPGVSTAATHGAIRVGHAVRGLAAGESPKRLRELADALASWAASYSELPAAQGLANGALTPREAIARVAVVPRGQRRPGNITTALAGLGDEFAHVIGRVDLGGDIDGLLAQLTELFARVYLANVSDTLTAIVFIHGVTSLTALGHVVPFLDDATARRLLRYGWQAGCGLYACFGSGAGLSADVAPGGEDAESLIVRDSLIERALANGDEHVIKFTEACFYRDALAPSPTYPAAVANALGIIGRR
jgi:hypothetical protein